MSIETHAGLEFQGALTPDMERAMKMKTEVYDNEPDLRSFLNETVNKIAMDNPRAVTTIGVFGESGVLKGTMLSQVAASDAKNTELYQAFADAGMTGGLMQHYSTTADGLIAGMTEDPPRITSAWGRFTESEFDYSSELLLRANEAAAWLLPQQYPDHGHRLYRESVGIISNPNIGNTVLDQVSYDPNAAIILTVTNPDIQKIAYEQRLRLWRDAQTIKQIEAATNSKFDLDTERIKMTMGNPHVMEVLSKKLNDDLYDAYQRGEIDLDKIPEELFAFVDPRRMDEKGCQRYFHNLTQFPGNEMITTGARPYILKQHLENMKGQLEARGAKVHLFEPKLITSKKVNSHPGYLRDHVLPISTYASLSA